MNILLTNDDGYAAAGLASAYDALTSLGTVSVVAPLSERSACSHSISLYHAIEVTRIEHDSFGTVYAVDGTPADCVRLGVGELLDHSIDLVVSGINRGANTGVDTYYSGTIAGAREAAMLGIPAIALSQAVRSKVETDWAATSAAAKALLDGLLGEVLPGPGFWSVNFPAPVPDVPLDHVHRVDVAAEPVPLNFDREPDGGNGEMRFQYGKAYWIRKVSEPSDFSIIRDGGIAVSAVPLFGRF